MFVNRLDTKMIKSKIRGLLYLLISVALLLIVIINLPSTTTISIVWRITDLRAQPVLLKGNSFIANRDEEMESPPLYDFSKRYSDENDTRRMSDIRIEGKIKSSRNYAVFSVSTDYINALDYIFYLPLTTLAWKRIGFDSVILVVGSSNESLLDPLIRYVLSRCLELEAVLIYIYSPPGYALTISQFGRLFAANILSTKFHDTEWVYLIASDVDFWPLQSDIYRLRSDMAILSLNVNCCAQFLHNGVQYKRPVISNIGMRVMTWNKLLIHDSFIPTSSHIMLKFLRREFGSAGLRRIRNNENQSRYLYQMTTSIMMENWIDEYGSNHVMFIPRNTAVDRLDFFRWKADSSVYGKVDVHMPLKGFQIATWKSIVPLLRTMYDYQSERYNWSLSHYESYLDHSQRQVDNSKEHLVA